MPTIPKEDLLPGEAQPVRQPPPPPPPTQPVGNKQQVEKEINARAALPPNPFGPVIPAQDPGALKISGGSNRGARAPLALGSVRSVDAAPGTNGAGRLLSEIVQTQYAVQSREYDNFILSRPYDPNDPDYNYALWQQKQAALGRQKKRGYNVDTVDVIPSWMVSQLAQRGLLTQPTGNFAAADRTASAVQPGGSFPQADRDASGLGGLNTGAQDYTNDNREEGAHDRREVQSQNQVDFYTKNPYTFVDKNGNVIINPDTRLPKKNLDPNDPAYEPGQDEYGDPLDQQAFVQSGGAVYMGTKEVTLANGKKIKVPVYRNTSEMVNDVAGMSVDERKAFQQSIGLPATGVADKKTISAWQTLILTAAYHTAYGQNYDLNWLKAQLFGTGGGGGGGGGRRGGGGGGGGGGGAGATMSKDQAKAMLNPVMRELAGREATEEEVNSFVGAAQAAFNANPDGWAPEQYTIDWVKTRVPQGVGTYQAATTYYDAVMSVLGGGVS